MRALCRLSFGALALLLVSSSCSSDGQGGPAPDSGPRGDALFYPCSNPGLACNAHDPCAINPICGQDGLCRPEQRVDCDDGLACTADTCEENGVCINKPLEGSCALLVRDPGGGTSEMRCFSQGAVHPDDPCRVCDAQTRPSAWSDSDRGSCDDGNPCTKGDRCQAGECKGTYYGSECSDGIDCTTDTCDGHGGCQHQLKSGFCLVGGQCYPDGAVSSSGCEVCDAAKSQSQWSPRQNICAIGSACYLAGSKDTTGCGVCDPSLSASTWSAAPGACFIQGACFASGAADPSGCASCDPTQSKSEWTLSSGKCLVNGSCYVTGASSPSGCGTCDPSRSEASFSPVSTATTAITSFDGDLGGYVLSPAVSGVGWQLSTKRAHSGSGSLYYGDSSRTLKGSGASSGTAQSPAVTLAAGQKAALFFWLYLDAETSPAHDVLRVRVGGATVWSKSAQTLPSSSYRRWVPIEVSLSAFAGQTVRVELQFDTVDAWSNSGEGVYLDDVAIVSGCL